MHAGDLLAMRFHLRQRLGWLMPFRQFVERWLDVGNVLAHRGLLSSDLREHALLFEGGAALELQDIGRGEAEVLFAIEVFGQPVE